MNPKIRCNEILITDAMGLEEGMCRLDNEFFKFLFIDQLDLYLFEYLTRLFVFIHLNMFN